MLTGRKPYIASLPLCSEPDRQILFCNDLWLTSFMLCGSAMVFKEWRSAYAFLRITDVTAICFAFHCCALLLCDWLAYHGSFEIKLELSRFSRNNFHFPTHYVLCYCQCYLTGTLCKSCQSILLPSLLIMTCNLYLNGIFHSKMDTNETEKEIHKAVIQYLTAQQLMKESIPAKGSRKVL